MIQTRALLPHRCVALLLGQELGRIGYIEDALPTIAPVTYVVRDGTVLVRTSASAAVLAGQVIAFSADDLDLGTRTGWSVVVVGKAEVLTETGLQEEPPECVLRIPMTVVHGRVRKMADVPYADVG